MKKSAYSVLISLLFVLLCTVELGAKEEAVQVDIKAGDAVDSLKELSAQTELQLFYPSDSLKGVKTQAVSGNYLPSVVLERLLEGTPFVAVQDSATGAFAIIRRKVETGEGQSEEHLTNQLSQAKEPTDMNQRNNENSNLLTGFLKGVLGLALVGSAPVVAQEDEEDIYELTPFEVPSDAEGYMATSSLAGTRLNTDLSDIGSSVQVFTAELMEDVGATDNETLLIYGVGTEVGGSRGNFINADSFGLENANVSQPNNNTRVRGLTSADNTRNFYLTDVPWDSYTVSRVDIQRGANSVLFGVGSPAGIINTSTQEAGMYTNGEVQFTIDKFSSNRIVLDYNREIIEDQLAVRVSYLLDDQKFRQKPAFDDDERIYITTTWQPEALNQDGQIFKFKINYENGQIESNRPRYIAPIDQISAWFAAPGTSGFQGEYADFADWGLGGRLINPIEENEIQTANNSSGRFYSPWVGTTFGGINPKLIYDETSNRHKLHTENNVSSRGGWFTSTDFPEAIVNDGNQTGNEVQGHIRGVSTMKIWGVNRAAADGGLPLQGFWKDSSFTDTSYFDFYNKLLDGNTKREFKDWDTIEFDLSHTFFDNKLGYQAGYFYQDYNSQFEANLGQVFVPAITVNIATLDRTATPENRVANPYAGRAYVSSDNPSGSFNNIDRESKRIQGFFSHDFSENSDSVLSRILGKHDIVGILQEREMTQWNRGYLLMGYDREYILGRGNDIINDNTPPPGARLVEYSNSNSGFNPDFHMYLDHDGSGIRGLSGIGDIIYPNGGQLSIQGFDATPLAGFDSAAASMQTWNDIYATDNADTFEFQSRNPDNYVGWSDVGPYGLINANDSESSLEYLTTNRARNTEKVESKALVWTGRFWDGAIVGMYGWREDDSTETWPNHSYTDDGNVFDPDDLVANGRGDEVFIRSTSTQSRNWSVKANMTYLTGLDDDLPFDVHVLYSEGEVQTPDPSRIDVFNRTLDNALGSTEDLSLMLITKDGKWSFRFTDYTTVVDNAVSNSTVNREKWRLQQVLQQGALRAGFIETDASGYTNDNLPLSPSAIAAGYTDEVTGEADYRRNVMAPAWRDFEARLWNEVPLAQGWYLTEFQPGDRTAPRILFPDGATLVEDQISEGYEFELTANPTANWTLAMNASKSNAIRDGLPGEDFGEAIDIIIEEMKGPAGEIPIWWNQGPGVGGWLDPFIGEVVLARALNGASQPEIREWRANFITNYRFSEGSLEGFGIGGAYRYEDGQIYSYLPTQDSDGNLGVDINTFWMDGSRSTFDFWLSYGAKLTDKIDWTIQLNIYNAFGENELVPLHRNPDGSFGQMGIREGKSWSIRNSFKF